MNKSIFSGACTALVTPFLDGKVNYPMAEQLVLRQIAAGIRTVILAGTTGEAPTLSDEEKITLVRRCKELVGDQCHIIAGTGSNATQHTLELSVKAQQAGADGLLIVSPYYNKANPDGLFVHYWTIAQAVNIPIIIYNVPSRTGMDIPVSVYEQLSKQPNIMGVKEANTDIRKIARTIAVCGPDFGVWSGNDDMIVPVMALGGQGVISVLSNIYPAETAAICDACLANDYIRAASLQLKMMDAIGNLFCEVNPIPVKYASRLIGLDCGSCRLPLTELTDENKKKLQEFFA